MANKSGTIYGSPAGNGNYLYIEWYEDAESISSSANTSKVYATVKMYNGYGSYSDGDACSWYVTIDGTTASGTIYTWSGTTVTVGSASKVVTHNSNGSKSITISAYFDTNNTSTGAVSASGTATLTSIPRYPSVSQSLSSKTETTITMDWSSDSTCDYVEYSKDNGSTWTAVGSVNSSSGSYTISSLSPGTSYKIKTRLRRKSSQLKNTSSASTISTYYYPYCTTTPDFTIGNAVTIGIYNPLGRSVSVEMTSYYDVHIGTNTTSSTSIKGWYSSSIIDTLYRQIPNDKYGVYKIIVTYGSHTSTKTGGKYYAGDSSHPSIDSATYIDENTTVTNITNNNKKVVPGKSKLKITASGLSAKRYATISSVKVNVGTTYTMSVSGSTATVSNAVVNSSEQKTATITLTDSRGFTATKKITLDTVSYQNPTVTATAKRYNGFYTSTTINVKANYTSIGTNAITIQLKAKKKGTSTYTISQTVTEGNNTIDFDNLYAWDVVLTITDSFGGSTTFRMSVGKGVPLLYFDINKSSVAVGTFPANSGSFEVAGDIYVKGHPTAIGWYDTHYNTSSLANGTTFADISGSSISLPAGRYIVTASINYSGNASGYRGLAFKTSDGTRVESSVLTPAIPSSSWTTRLSSTLILSVETSDTVSLMGLQNSGSSLSATWYIKAIRIR